MVLTMGATFVLESDPIHLNSTAWPSEVSEKLSDLSEASRSAARLLDKLRPNWPPEPSPEMMKKYPKLAGYSSLELLRAGIAARKQFMATFGPALAEQKRLLGELKSLSALMATPSFMEWSAAQARPLKVGSDDPDERSYVLYRGSVWSSSRALQVGQWQILVDRIIKSEDAQLASALAEGSVLSQGRERISTEIRRAVWTRDQGKCARCGNRERLEFDHIVPISRGGSNTERNIELLCEVCNRAKSDSIM